MRELENYKEIDAFNAMQYEKELMRKSRLSYDREDGAVTINTTQDANWH